MVLVGGRPLKYVKNYLTATRITSADSHFFFGYYDRLPISTDGRYHLAVHPGFMDRPNTGADKAEIGIVDLKDDNKWTPLDDQTAWNWQMAANDLWLGPAADRKIIYNVRQGDRVFARIRDIAAGDVRDLDRPVYTVSKDGRFAVSVNFARIHTCRAGYGHADVPDPWEGVPASDEDGLYHVDLETGESRLIVSLAWCRHNDPDPTMEVGLHWFNHIMINPSGTRIMFLHRWQIGGGKRWSRLYTCASDGSDLYFLNRGWGISHADWRDDVRVLSWCHHGSDEWHYYLMTDKTQDADIIAPEIMTDGHCSYTPRADKRWILTDNYPDKETLLHDLILYDTRTDTRVDVGRFAGLPGHTDEIRCDFHPRWNSTGDVITFDSFHEGFRGIYMMDVSDIVG